MSDVTRILQAIERGEPKAADELLPLVYEELRKLAAHKMASERAGHTLQPTALVHEAWLRLAGEHKQGWAGRAQFFSAAAEAMRRILVERARATVDVALRWRPLGRAVFYDPLHRRQRGQNLLDRRPRVPVFPLQRTQFGQTATEPDELVQRLVVEGVGFGLPRYQQQLHLARAPRDHLVPGRRGVELGHSFGQRVALGRHSLLTSSSVHPFRIRYLQLLLNPAAQATTAPAAFACVCGQAAAGHPRSGREIVG
jgi:hypothetical protein